MPIAISLLYIIGFDVIILFIYGIIDRYRLNARIENTWNVHGVAASGKPCAPGGEAGKIPRRTGRKLV